MMRWVDPVDRAGRLRLVGPHACRPSAPGKTRCCEHMLRPGRVHLAAHLSQQLRRRHAGVPRQPRPDGQLHRGGGGDRRRGGGAAALAQAHHAELRRMERLVPHAPQPRGRGVKPGWPVAPPILEEVYNMEDALAFGGALHLAAQPRRPREGGLPGAAGQRDRADHDRDRRPGLAPDDLPSLRAFQPHGPRPRAARRDRIRRPMRRSYYDPRGPMDDYYDIPAAPYLKLVGRARRQGGHADAVRAEPQPRRGDAARSRSRRASRSIAVRQALQLCDPDLRAVNTKAQPDRVTSQAAGQGEGRRPSASWRRWRPPHGT